MRHDTGAQPASDNQESWSEELPEDENQPFSNPQADLEEMPKQDIEEGAAQGDVQADQMLTNDNQLQDAGKYTFPPGWCDISSIPATGWGD